MEIELPEWLESTQSRRDELDLFGISPLPTDIGERHQDIEKSIQCSSDAARLLADGESFLTHAVAQSMFRVAKEHDDLSVREREVIIKDDVRQLNRLVEGLRITAKTIQARIYASLNANRSR